MPFKSEAQRRWMYANDKAMAERWEKHTPKGKKLPEKVKNQTNKNAELKSGFKRNSMDVKTLAKQAVADTDKDVTGFLMKKFQPGYRQFADGTFSMDQNQIDRFSKGHGGAQYVFGNKDVTPGRFKGNVGTTAKAVGGQLAGAGALGLLASIVAGKFGKGLGRLVGGKFVAGGQGGLKRYSQLNPIQRAAVDQVDDILARRPGVELGVKDKLKDGLLGIGAKLDPELVGSRTAAREFGEEAGQLLGGITGGTTGVYSGAELARKAMGPQEMISQLPGYDEKGNRTLVQKVKDMFSAARKEASDIEKLAYATALEKEAYLGTVGGGILGGGLGALMSEPGYRADSFGHGALRGAGAGAGAGIGGLAGLLAAYKMSRPNPLGLNVPESRNTKIMQALLPVLGAAGGGVVGYGASKALGGESQLEKKRRKEEENEKEASEKEASLAVTFALINALRQKRGDRVEGGLRGFGTGLGAEFGVLGGFPLGLLAAKGHPLGGLAGVLGGGYLGAKGAQKLMGKADYSGTEAAVKDLAKSAAGRCWDGYEPVPGKDAYSDDSCRKIGSKKKKKSEKEAAEKQANLANIIKALKTLGKRTALFGGTGLAGYGIGRSHGFDSGQESIKDMSLKEIMDLSMPKMEVAKQAGAIQELAKEAGKRGLWDNIHAKRKRGEKPAKKGDKDYPDEKSWKKTTKASK